MTQEEIYEYNKRCAEFLGWKYLNDNIIDMWMKVPIEFRRKVYFNSSPIQQKYSMMFHEDWNWIMEVVEVIEKLGYRILMVTDEVDIESSAENPIQKSLGTYCPDGTKKGAVVQAINQFLIWYENETDKIK
jgi:hypothetical protein